MKKLLEKCMIEKKIITVYPSFYDLEMSVVGYVYSLDNKTIFLQVVSSDGYYLGCKILLIEDIVMIDTNSNNAKKIEFLLNNFHGNYKQININAESYYDILLYSKNNNLILDIYSDQNQINYITGIAKNIENGIASIYLVDKYGEFQENVNIPIVSIRSIEYGSKKLQILEFLNKNLK